ncbi:MAG: thiamine diphosphokinase [Opitutales bacterium]|nr:thiamine diphosphokinase [Opitutales bacterium]
MTLGGHAPSAELLKWRVEEAELSIAVDGGCLAHCDADVEPDVILGDFDSCGALSDIEMKFPRSEIHELPDQEHTDFEKSVSWMMNRGVPKQLVILGGLGKRTDHCLSNLMTAARINPSVKVVFDDVHEYVRRITPHSSFSLNGRSGSTLSLLPMGKCEGVESSGLQWELQGVDFSWDRMVSQSNQCVADEVRVECQKGVLFAFVSKES